MEHCVLPVQLQDHSYCSTTMRQPRSQAKAKGYWKEVLSGRLSHQPYPDSPPGRPPLSCGNCVPRTDPRPRAPRRKPNYRRNAAVLPEYLGSLPLRPAEEPTPLPSATDEPLRIHGHAVDQYQRIYHSVVDDMLTYESGCPRPYSLELGRRIKQRLWEALSRPSLTVEETSSGLLRVQESSSSEVCAPHIDLDTSDEPPPKRPRRQ